jgi:hypothetical protein
VDGREEVHLIYRCRHNISAGVSDGCYRTYLIDELETFPETLASMGIINFVTVVMDAFGVFPFSLKLYLQVGKQLPIG